MTTITTPARAVGITVHVPIDPPRRVTPAEHVAAGKDFTADTALWGWSTHGGSKVSLHAIDRPSRCLSFYAADIPDWLPRPPAEWEAAAAVFIAAVTVSA